MAEATTQLARRRPRIADLPAGPVLNLLALVPKAGPRAYIHLRGGGAGRVLIEAGGGALVAAVEVRGELAREVALPRAGVALLQRRHGAADRLTVDGALPDGPPGGLLLRALDATSAASVACLEEEIQPGTVSELIAEDRPLLAGAERSCLLNLQLLGQAADTLRRLCPGAADVEMPRHDLLAVVLRGRPDPDGDVVGCAVALARCVRPSEAQR